ncbi:MAG: M15 family metallopeptidase [Burkholderiales bacterium]
MRTAALNELELTGRARTHITQLEEPRCALHHGVVQPFVAMRAEAAQEGIDLRPYSSFRDFDTQVLIWNRKFRGERTLYSRDGQVMDAAVLTEAQKIDAILTWSALPGTSRHHWGTEIDVYDHAAMPEGYRVQLLPEEYAPDGVFGKLAQWLGPNLERFGFFRPYDQERGGISPEPWHISYAPVAALAQAALTGDVVAQALQAADLLGRELVLQSLPALLRQYVANVAQPSAIVLAHSSLQPTA